ncbi:MAG: response regulator transcription factor [Cellulosilyticum sp.]|nr:response regulator transcription factor [Cellulosilyticum sp.]
MKNRVLIIDDDVELSQLLKDCLLQEGLSVDVVHDGISGLRKGIINEYELIVLDIMLPEMNGFEVLTSLREKTEVPVLMLTAKNSEVDKVSGLRLGADDYLTKPFSINEFIARVASLIRRYTKFTGQVSREEKTLVFHKLIIDKVHRVVKIQDQNIDLTSKEFDVLYLLASQPGRVYTKKQIYVEVWQDDYAFDDNNIMAYMSKLRKKLNVHLEGKEYIQTVWGIGYRFNSEV